MSIQSNRITVIEGLDHLTSLEELYLSHNGIKCIQGLEKLVREYYPLSSVTFISNLQVNLTTLDLANNQIKRLENVAHLVKLEEFWVRLLANL